MEPHLDPRDLCMNIMNTEVMGSSFIKLWRGCNLHKSKVCVCTPFSLGCFQGDATYINWTEFKYPETSWNAWFTDSAGVTTVRKIDHNFCNNKTYTYTAIVFCHLFAKTRQGKGLDWNPITDEEVKVNRHKSELCKTDENTLTQYQ